MPTLDWIGKDKVINHHGDNLDALKNLLPRYEGKVKYICKRLMLGCAIMNWKFYR